MRQVAFALLDVEGVRIDRDRKFRLRKLWTGSAGWRGEEEDQ